MSINEQEKNTTARIILALGVIVAVFGLGMAVAGMCFYELILHLHL